MILQKYSGPSIGEKGTAIADILEALKQY